MYFQKTDYTCGPASIRIAMRVLGYSPPSEQALAKVCGTSESEGTDEEGVKRGLMHYGFTRLEELRFKTPYEAQGFLYDKLWYPVILCVERWSHWVCIVGALDTQGGDKRILIADPARYGYNTETNGLRSYGVMGLVRHWRLGKRKKNENYYGIVVHERVDHE